MTEAPVHEIDAAEANRRFYREIASTYDEQEYAVMNPWAQELLRDLLSRALEPLPDRPRVLDACGGSGNASQILVEMGVSPVLVDVSPEMLGRWREKARALNHDPEIVEGEILDFLRDDPRHWDLIVFSSALHHLEDYSGALAAAVDRVAPGGAVITVFDPLRGGRVHRWLRLADWLLFQAIHEPREFLATLRNRLRRARTGAPPIGRLAERYAIEGVDDEALVQLLEQRGMEIELHRRLPEARLAPVRAAMRVLRSPSAFNMIARRPRGGEDASPP